MSRTPCMLVVEDDIHISRLLAVLLEEAGYQVLTSGTAADALAIVDQQSLDLIILDRMLPDMSGDQICQIVKTRPTHVFLPVLMLTARSELADRVTGLDAGADEYLTKPFHADELLARVRALLRIRAAEIQRTEALATLEQQHEQLKTAYERLRSAQAQLVQASKLASLGELVAGVAHELNNPLAIILGNAELLSPPTDEEDRRAVRQIIDAAQRGRRVVQSLVTFARHGNVAVDWHNPHDLVERVLDLKRGSFRTGNVTLDVIYDPLVPMLLCDGPQIQQALLNVLVNAEHAVAERAQPRIVIHVYTAHAPVELPTVFPNLTHAGGEQRSEPMIVIDIADNGPGLPMHIIDRLFEPFVTTRPVGQGTGMGLAIAYAIVMQHGGTLNVASQPDRGATFRIVLPVAGRADAKPAGSSLGPALEQKRVMVIDDEPAIVELVKRLLERSGYRVVGLNWTRHAVDELRRQTCDTILCDIRMPEFDGIAFYDQLRALELEPQPRLVIMTGDSNNAYTEDFIHQHNLTVLRKPFTRQELLAAIANTRA